MENTEIRKIIRELMKQYNENLRKWIGLHGTEEGFDAWFTDKVLTATIKSDKTIYDED